jgi:hypothetical protein
MVCCIAAQEEGAEAVRGEPLAFIICECGLYATDCEWIVLMQKTLTEVSVDEIKGAGNHY